MKSAAIQIMNEQDFGYKGTQNNIAYFDNVSFQGLTL